MLCVARADRTLGVPMKVVHLLFLLAIVCPALVSTDQKTKLRNFVFFRVNDFGWTDLKCFGSGFYDTIEKVLLAMLKKVASKD